MFFGLVLYNWTSTIMSFDYIFYASFSENAFRKKISHLLKALSMRPAVKQWLHRKIYFIFCLISVIGENDLKKKNCEL